MNKKSICFKVGAAVLGTTFLFACTNNAVAQINTETEVVVTEQSNLNNSGDKNSSSVISEMAIYNSDDEYSNWENQNPIFIELKGSDASIKGVGAEVKNSKITITAAGVYVISGKLDNGQIIVDVADKGNVRLVLNNVTINCNDNAPIYVKKAGKTIITLQEGTENVISDGEKYIFPDATTDEPNAALFSKADLTLNGTGKLTVHGNYNNGITSKDSLKITGGTFDIYSADDGLMGRDMVAVRAGNITIEAGGDGIKSTNDSDSAKGLIVLEGGVFKITAENDGMQAENSIMITDGLYTINSGGGSSNSRHETGNNRQNLSVSKGTQVVTSLDETESKSTKGIKATAEISITGGTFDIDSADDAVHSNNSINLSGGDLSITSGDDGIHADAFISINGGKINITKSYEGIESAIITISDGEIHITSSDDGINVAGGNDESAINGRPGQNNFTSSGDNKLNINGGYIVVNAAGDGLDANGSIYMTDGTVIVNGPTSNNNGALDYDRTFEMTGGLLIAAGSSRMAQTTSEQSVQHTIIMSYSQIQQAGTLVHLKDSEGNEVVTFAPQKNYQSIVISSPELKKGIAYTLYSGGTSTGSSSEGLYTQGEYKTGTKIIDFTILNAVTWLSETGVTTGQSTGQGMPKNPALERGQNGTEKRKQ